MYSAYECVLTNAATAPTTRPSCSATTYAGAQPVRPPTERDSSRAARKPWRRNGDGPWSSASQAARSISAMRPTTRTVLCIAHDPDARAAPEDRRPDQVRRRRAVHEGQPELPAVRVLGGGREHPQHLDPEVHD